MDYQHDTSGPVGLAPPSWTSSWVPELPIRLDILYKYFVIIAEDNKAVFFYRCLMCFYLILILTEGLLSNTPRQACIVPPPAPPTW
jgi:hypothetical protein